MEIKPRIDEKGEPVCGGRACLMWGSDDCVWGENEDGKAYVCIPALRQQRDEARRSCIIAIFDFDEDARKEHREAASKRWGTAVADALFPPIPIEPPAQEKP